VIKKIRKKLIKRLAVVALVLAALLGTIVFVLEMQHVDKHVLQLALDESRSLTEHIAFLSLKDRRDFEMVKAQVEEHLLMEHVSGKHFVVIELYDRNRKKVIEVSDPGIEHVEDLINNIPHVTLLRDRIDHRKHYIDGQFYVQVFTPIEYATGELVAYFEGIYRVDADTMRAITKRLAWTVLQVVLAIFATTAFLYPVILVLNRDMIRLSDGLAEANMGILEALGSAVSKRDRGTQSHNYRVTLYAIRLAEEVGLSDEKIRGLIKGAYLHDIGKIGVTDSILHKPGPLTEAETAVMRTHVEHGVDIIKSLSWLKDAVDVVCCHHEKYDGSGYGTGMKGTDIPVQARIFAIVDVFDALTSKRPYREPATYEEACKAMMAERGARFDPELLDRFMKIAPELHRKICLADEGRLARMLVERRARYFPAL